VFLGAVPFLGLIGLLHRKVCISPFGLGARIPRKARERAWRTKALWRVCRRIICTCNSGCQTGNDSERPTSPDSAPTWPILPRSIRLVTVRSLARAGWAVLFFVGPRRQTTLSIGSGEPVRTARPLGGEPGRWRLTAPPRRLWTAVSVTNPAIHFSPVQG
jgi:hypothetical protein